MAIRSTALLRNSLFTTDAQELLPAPPTSNPTPALTSPLPHPRLLPRQRPLIVFPYHTHQTHQNDPCSCHWHLSVATGEVRDVESSPSSSCLVMIEFMNIISTLIHFMS